MLALCYRGIERLNHSRRTSAPKLWLGPKTLAMLSCALTLLAAQPILAADGRTNEAKSTIRIAGQVQTSSRTNILVRSDASRPAQAVRRTNTPSLSTRQLHILATLEIFQRLMAFELRPTDQLHLPALIYAPTTLAFIQTVPLPTRSLIVDAATPKLTAEQSFSLTHCLLAPPTRV